MVVETREQVGTRRFMVGPGRRGRVASASILSRLASTFTHLPSFHMSCAVPLRLARVTRNLPLRTTLRAPQRRFKSRKASSSSLQTGVTRDKSKEDEFDRLDEDEKLAAVEKALKVEHIWKRMGYDMWAEPAETLGAKLSLLQVMACTYAGRI